MDFIDSPDQAALRGVVRDFLRQHATPERVRQGIADPAGYDVAAWKRLTGELALTGLAVPERFGGMGATLAEVAVAIEEIGRVLLPVPYLSSALVAAVLGEASAPEAAEAFRPGLADGTLIGAFALVGDVTVAEGRASGVAQFVLDGPYADVFLVRAGDALVAVRATDVTVIAVGTLDRTRAQASLVFTDAPALLVGAGALSHRAEDVVRTALAVESVGAADHCLAATVAYLKERVQFGKPIGTFQALKHRCADLAVEIESARATAHAAVWTAVADPDELGVLGPLAKRHCAEAFVHTAAETIQLLGGIGFTWEHEAHLYLKRAKSTQLLHGSPGELRRLIAQRAGLT
jgi:alkylation response protein AidB-like acyl-CoA dehydrogenase